jgi:hypothetical protein
MQILIGSPDGVFQRAVQFARFKGFDEKFRNAESDGALGLVKLAVGGYHDADRIPAGRPHFFNHIESVHARHAISVITISADFADEHKPSSPLSASPAHSSYAQRQSNVRISPAGAEIES